MQSISNLLKNRAAAFHETVRELAPKTEGGKFFIISNDFALYMMKEIKQVYGRSMLNAVPRILMVLAKHGDKRGISYPSQKLIMELGAITNKNTLIKAVKIMEDLRMLVRKKGGGKIANIYQLTNSSHWISPQRLKYQNERSGIRNEGLMVADADTRIRPINKTLEQEES